LEWFSAVFHARTSHFTGTPKERVIVLKTNHPFNSVKFTQHGFCRKRNRYISRFILYLHFQRSPSLARFSPGQLVDLRIIGDFTGLVQFKLLAGAGAQIAELDIGRHETGIAVIGLAELAGLFASASHEEFLVMVDEKIGEKAMRLRTKPEPHTLSD
jgi:hypothetical protein